MTILDKTRELGEVITSSEEMKRVKAAQLAQSRDENAQDLLREFNLNRMNLARDMQNGKLSREEAIEKNEEAFKKVLDGSETVREFVEAKKEFDNIIAQMNQMLNFYVTGQEPGCTHDCSTCGGCQ